MFTLMLQSLSTEMRYKAGSKPAWKRSFGGKKQFVRKCRACLSNLSTVAHIESELHHRIKII